MKHKLKIMTVYSVILAFVISLVSVYTDQAFNTIVFADENIDIVETEQESGSSPASDSTKSTNYDNRRGIFFDNREKDEPSETNLLKAEKFETELLSTLGILLPENMEDLDMQVTRGEAAQVIARIINVNTEGYVSASDIFKDVAQDNPAKGAIGFVSSMGIIQGYEGNYYPEQPITFNEAVKMFVSLMGFKLIAEERGGYPEGYFAVAKDKKLLQGITFVANGQISRKEFYKLVYNALHTDMLITVNYGNNTELKEIKNRNLLSEYLKVEKYEGVMVDNGYTRLDQNTGIGYNQIAIKTKDSDVPYVFDSKDEKHKELLGYNVRCYVKESSSDNDEVVYLAATSGKNDILVIDADDIVQFRNNTYYYYEDDNNGKTVTAEIDAATDKIYNGVAAPNLLNDKMCPASGKVILLDNNNDNTYDVVFIQSCVNIAVDNVAADKQIIRDRYDLSLTMDLNPEENDVKVIIDGEQAKFTNIYRWDIATIMKSETKVRGKYLVTINISNNKVEGKLDELTADYENVVIEGQKYELSAELKKVLIEKDFLQPGETYTFVTNVFGKISAVQNPTELDDSLVLLTDASISKGVGNNLKIKVFTTANRFEELDCTEKCNFDGSKDKSNEDKLQLLKRGNAQIPIQVIKIRKDSKNRVTSIDIGKVPTDDMGEEIINADSTPLILNIFNQEISYRPATRCFDGKFYVDGSTVIFSVPNDTADDNEYEILKMKDLQESTCKVQAYNINDNGVAKALVVARELATYIPATTDMVGIVDRITDSYDTEKDTYIKKLYFYKGGKLTSIRLENTEIIDIPADLAKGDIFRYSLNPRNGKLWYFKRIYDISKRDDVGTINELSYSGTRYTDYDYTLRFVFGQPYSRIGSLIRLRTINKISDNPLKVEANYFYYDLSKTPIFRYNMSGSNPDMLDGSLAEILDFTSVKDWSQASKLFLRTIKGEVKEVIIYDFDE